MATHQVTRGAGYNIESDLWDCDLSMVVLVWESEEVFSL